MYQSYRQSDQAGFSRSSQMLLRAKLPRQAVILDPVTSLLFIRPVL